MTVNAPPSYCGGYFGTRPWSWSHHRMHLCATSTGSQNIIGQPPTMQLTLRARHSRTASSDTLPFPNDRWNHT